MVSWRHVMTERKLDFLLPITRHDSKNDSVHYGVMHDNFLRTDTIWRRARIVSILPANAAHSDAWVANRTSVRGASSSINRVIGSNFSSANLNYHVIFILRWENKKRGKYYGDLYQLLKKIQRVKCKQKFIPKTRITEYNFDNKLRIKFWVKLPVIWNGIFCSSFPFMYFFRKFK